MQRREFITLLGGAAAAWPMAAQAQQGERMRRIGVLMPVVEGDPEAQRYIAAFVQGLHELGWAPGRNLQIEYRWGGPDRERIRAYADELVGLKPDVILAQTSLVMPPLRQATRTIPIIFMQINDPVESGMVASMARPGGNITGFTELRIDGCAGNGCRRSRRSRRPSREWQSLLTPTNLLKLPFCARSRLWLLRSGCA